MSEVRVGIFHFGSDYFLADRVGQALARLEPSLEVYRVSVEDAELQHPYDFDWAILTVTKASLSHPSFPDVDLMPSGLISRNGTVIVTDHRLKRSLDSFGSKVVNLSGWRGNQSDKRIRTILKVVTGPPLLEQDLPLSPIEHRIEREVAEIPVRSGELPLNPALFLRVEDLPFSPRAARILFFDNIIYLGDAIQRDANEWRAFPEIDEEMLDEFRTIFGTYGLPMGADIPEWPPEDFESHVRRAEAALRTAGMRQAPVGVIFEARSDFLVINPAGDDSDQAAALKPAFEQLHTEIIRKARQFGSVAPRLDNQVGWQGISGLCERMIALLDRPTDTIPDVVGSLYGAALELGSFFEMDRGIRRGEDSFATPLDAEVRRPLEDLIRNLAPWLRNLPTIREMDDEAGQFLVPPPPLEPSADVIRTAGRTRLISEGDAELLRGLLDAAKRGEFQGAKAGHRGFLSARNMVIAVAGLYGGLVLGDYAGKSVLIGKAGAFLAQKEAEIIELVADLPPDLRSAIETIIKENREAPILPPAEPRPVSAEGTRPVRRPVRGEE